MVGEQKVSAQVFIVAKHVYDGDPEPQTFAMQLDVAGAQNRACKDYYGVDFDPKPYLTAPRTADCGSFAKRRAAAAYQFGSLASWKPTAEELHLVGAANRVDARLYSHALLRFERELAALRRGSAAD